MGVWQFIVLRVLNRGRILLICPSPNCRINLFSACVLYSLARVERWKNTLYLGIDACFKLKLKDRGFDDPDLGTGLAYMVNEDSYQTYLSANKGSNEPVSYHLSI